MAGVTTEKAKAKRRLKNVRVNEISLVDNPAVPDARIVVAKRDDDTDDILELAKETAEAELRKMFNAAEMQADHETYVTKELLHMAAGLIGAMHAIRKMSREVPSEAMTAIAGVLSSQGISVPGVTMEKSFTDLEGKLDALIESLGKAETGEASEATETTETTGDTTETSESGAGETPEETAETAETDADTAEAAGETGDSETATETTDTAGDSAEGNVAPEAAPAEKSLTELVEEEWQRRMAERERLQKREREQQAAQDEDRLVKALESLGSKMERTAAELQSLSDRVDRAAGKGK